MCSPPRSPRRTSWPVASRHCRRSPRSSRFRATFPRIRARSWRSSATPNCCSARRCRHRRACRRRTTRRTSPRSPPVPGILPKPPATMPTCRRRDSPVRVRMEMLPADLRRAWVTEDGRSRLEIFPKGDPRDNTILQRFVAAVRTLAPQATGTPVTIQESGSTVVAAFTRAGWIAITAITALLLVMLRRPWDVVLVLTPLCLAGLLTAATSVLLDLPLNYANIITLPLLLGIGVAFDIYFVMRWRAGMSGPLQSSTARAVLFSALTTMTAFGSLALSSHPGTAEMGRLLTIALGYVLLCTLFVLPALQGEVLKR